MRSSTLQPMQVSNIITVIIVTKNSDDILPRALTSLNLQSDVHFNVIIKYCSDQLLPMDTVKERLSNLNPTNILTVCKQDSGIYDAINQAIEFVVDGYIALLHSDDTYPRDAISRMKEAIHCNPSDIMYGINRHVTKEQTERCLIRQNHRSLILPSMTTVEHTSALIHKRCFNSNGLYSTSFRIAADYEFFLRAFINKASFYPADYIFCNHTQGGLSQRRPHLARSEMLSIKLKYHIISLKQFCFLSIASLIESILRQCLSYLK